jgi:hypothetical protein
MSIDKEIEYIDISDLAGCVAYGIKGGGIALSNMIIDMFNYGLITKESIVCLWKIKFIK